MTAGIGAIAAGLYNRKALGEGIKNLFKKKGDKLGGNPATLINARNKPNSRLVNYENNYIRGTKPGVYTDLQTTLEQALT